MDWLKKISDFIYYSFKWFGPFIWIPICLLLILVTVFLSKLMESIKIPDKIQIIVFYVLLIAVIVALFIILSKYPIIDWMEGTWLPVWGGYSRQTI